VQHRPAGLGVDAGATLFKEIVLQWFR
jgi:hypothetical protein